eukprot:3519798-Pleurochrysis_carterae.AAC.2
MACVVEDPQKTICARGYYTEEDVMEEIENMMKVRVITMQHTSPWHSGLGDCPLPDAVPLHLLLHKLYE